MRISILRRLRMRMVRCQTLQIYCMQESLHRRISSVPGNYRHQATIHPNDSNRSRIRIHQPSDASSYIYVYIYMCIYIYMSLALLCMSFSFSCSRSFLLSLLFSLHILQFGPTYSNLRINIYLYMYIHIYRYVFIYI